MRFIILTILMCFTLSLPFATNRVYLMGGIEPGVMTTLGYERDIAIKSLDRTISLYTELGLSIMRLDIENSNYELGVRLPLWEWRSLKIIDNLYTTMGSINTHNFDSTVFTLGSEINMGYYGTYGYITTLIEYEKFLFSHLIHTDYYRSTYYPNAVDGWYKSSGGMFQFGLKGGFSLWNTDISLEIKKGFTEQFNTYASPLHINILVGYSF